MGHESTHKHCKECGQIILKVSAYKYEWKRQKSYDLSICVDCVFKLGLSVIEKKLKRQ